MQTRAVVEWMNWSVVAAGTVLIAIGLSGDWTGWTPRLLVVGGSCSVFFGLLQAARPRVGRTTVVVPQCDCCGYPWSEKHHGRCPECGKLYVELPPSRDSARRAPALCAISAATTARTAERM
jgi:hypothetical protein